MLRGLPHAEEHAREAIEVARRIGDRFAEANARVNYVTTRSTRGIAPGEPEIREIVELAIDAGAYDEGYRAIVNYIWGAAAFAHLDELERTAASMLERLSGLWLHPPESYAHYLEISLVKLVRIPSGHWDAVEASLVEPDVPVATSNRMVWLEVVAGMAMRRGDLLAADKALVGFRDWALGSDEPQRVLPLAGVALPRAALAGDLETIKSLTANVLDFAGRALWTFYAPVSLPRALAQAGAHDLLMTFLDAFESENGDATTAGAIVLGAGRGLVAQVDGRAQEAVELLQTAVAGANARGARYEGACLELDLGLALDAAGKPTGGEAARARARAVLEPLGCVNPV
jgi:hypothetical protein